MEALLRRLEADDCDPLRDPDEEAGAPVRLRDLDVTGVVPAAAEAGGVIAAPAAAADDELGVAGLDFAPASGDCDGTGLADPTPLGFDGGEDEADGAGELPVDSKGESTGDKASAH